MSDQSIVETAEPFQISNTLASFIAGTLGGIAGVVCGHPFDTIKVRLQSQNVAKPMYRGTLHCCTTILKQEGARGLFKGMSSPMAGVAVVNALLFGVYGALLDMQREPNDTSPASLKQIFIAGSGSGIINSLVSSPMELVKIRLQNQGLDHHVPTLRERLRAVKSHKPLARATSDKYAGPIDCMRQIYRESGFRGLYRGFFATLIRETPSYGAYFVSYEVLCRWLAPEGTDPKDLSGVRLMLAGGLGGIVGWASTYPIDVVKTIIQSDPPPGEKKVPSIGSTLRQIHQEQGLRSLFRGFAATVIRAFPTNVAILSTFHMTMLYFRQLGITSSTL